MRLGAGASLLIVITRSLETGERVSMRKAKGTYGGRRGYVLFIPLHVNVGVCEFVRVAGNVGGLKLSGRAEALGDGHGVGSGLREIRNRVK
jgi:hypothetical protein